MSQNEMHFDLAIIGAGFSGTMVAVHRFTARRRAPTSQQLTTGQS
jgi:cation diffusion facilitator CzcD-associated flavoprotein CzcO